MVFTQRDIPSVHKLNPVSLSDDFPRDHVLAATGQAAMVGLMQQMVLLSSHASGVFDCGSFFSF